MVQPNCGLVRDIHRGVHVLLCVLQEADAKTGLNVQSFSQGKCLWVNTGRKCRNLRSSWIMMQVWQREGGTSGWKFPGLPCSLRKVDPNTRVSEAKPDFAESWVCQDGPAFVFHTQSLTRHGLWEVWPWHRCSHELQSTAAGFQIKDDPCCGRSARHRLRAATCRSTLDPELNWTKGGLSRVAYTWVVPWIHIKLVLWRKKGESQTGTALRREVYCRFRASHKE